MNASEKLAFTKCIESLFTAFDREATKPLFNAYWWGLNDMQLAEVQEAVILALRRSKSSLPKPVELRELVRGTQASQAELGWMVATKAICAQGPYKHVDFSGLDRTINAVIRVLGGWPTFCARFTDAESEKWTRIDFLKAFERIAHRPMCDELYEALPGLTEMPVAPVMIGVTRSAGRLSPGGHQLLLAADDKLSTLAVAPTAASAKRERSSINKKTTVEETTVAKVEGS